MTKLNLVALILLSAALGYLLAAQPAQAGSASITDSASRMANALERIELRLKECR